MICQNCNAEMPDDAAFCPFCGAKHVRTDICPKCGKPFAEGEVYCTACGARLDGKTVCRNCGTAFEGRFCPACGTAVDAKPAAVPAAATAAAPAVATAAAADEFAVPAEKKAFDWRKLLLIIGGACSMAAVFFSLLFTFFIGFGVSIAGATTQQVESLLGNQSSVNIWYYFSKAYKDVDAVIQAALLANGEVSTFAKSSLYMEAVMGTLTACITIVAVVVFSTLAVVRYVRHMLHKSDKGAGEFACLAVFFFIAGTLALRALFDKQISVSIGLSSLSAQTVRIDTALDINAATKAGLTLAAIFLGLWFGCNIATRGKELITKSGLRALIPAAAGMVLLAVVLAVAGYGAVGFSGNDLLRSLTGYNGSLEVTLGFPIIFKVLAGEFITLPYEGAADAAAAYSYIAAIFTLAVVVLACVNFARLAAYSTEERGSVLPEAITLFVCGMIYMVFSILSINTTVDVILTKLEATDTVIETKFTTAIVVGVFVTLNLAAAIVHKVLTREN